MAVLLATRPERYAGVLTDAAKALANRIALS
jgi:hypothetical protein